MRGAPDRREPHPVGSAHPTLTGTTEIVDSSGRRSAPIGRLSQLSVGPFRSANLQFSTGMHNILGLNYLRRYRVTIDYSRQRLHLAEGRRFAGPDRGSMSGLLFLFQSDRVVIKWVDEKGPAYAAGVRAKDIVREISGRPVSKMTSSEIRRILRSPQGAPVPMSLERAGKPKILTETGFPSAVGYHIEGERTVVPESDPECFSEAMQEFVTLIARANREYGGRLQTMYFYEWRDNLYHDKIWNIEQSPIHTAFGLCERDGQPKLEIRRLVELAEERD